MTSQVNTAFPADNVKVSKADFRAQMLIISNEITALQQRTSVAGAQAYADFVTSNEVARLIRNSKPSLARDIAFSRVSL